ncbi:MAG TPA: bifunctional phosphopantothenoylcysteine decarboxylase/phosphopantothenate--cysteine ligase CoaBC [Spirochaetota bacterium]|nr:bifunctional phosphopantothenoylcysteine decarboxylase/phosphopantothenate--cysteine ligase CoaBC [Spirochaetota bacterium]HOM08872.1 bifunctional phosphopantothenoylcysteine decarboxylase/phosphopantothenate--cysteine ligase CoaBC [Spirochaetota bacterium]
MKQKIILGISSSIAAYKACDLARLLTKDGYDVFCVLTENATHLVAPLTLQTLTGNPVYTTSFAIQWREMGHIELKENAALLLVAPATANIIGKFANGIADDLLSTTFLAVNCPVVIAPAMNPNMWKHKAVQENIKKLKEWGCIFVEPETGLVACGDEGQGRLASIEEIYKVAINAITR